MSDTSAPERTGFRHEAFLYASDDEYVGRLAAFVDDARASDECVVVAVGPRETAMLRDAIGPHDDVQFVDMRDLGRNPGRIIPAWAAFLSDHVARGRRVRGIGEPAWPGRTPEELVECDHQEQLLNVAFDDGAPWWLLCPYDAAHLDAAVLEAARRNHAGMVASPPEVIGPFDQPLPDPGPVPFSYEVVPGELRVLRQHLAGFAWSEGLRGHRLDDLVLAVDELASNSLLHGGGRGAVRAWASDGAVVVEVRDTGVIGDPLVGRIVPPVDQPSGRGVWLVNQLCDLVQLRSSASGTVVRVRVARD